jgi:hypothetical protein
MGFIGDQLCSSACAFADAARVCCFAASGGFSSVDTAGWTAVADSCLSGSGATVAQLAGALPYAIRLVQCFRRHRDMRQAGVAAMAAGGRMPANPHMYNAIKYVLSIGLVWASASGHQEVRLDFDVRVSERGLFLHGSRSLLLSSNTAVSERGNTYQEWSKSCRFGFVWPCWRRATHSTGTS